MAQILAIDYGKARCGIAATDDMQIVASPVGSFPTGKIFDFFEDYFKTNRVETLVVGLPTDLRGVMSEVETDILKFIEEFRKKFPDIAVERYDERFTSKIASYFISQSGKNKKARQEKGLIDKVSATIVLQNYLETKRK